MKKTIILSFLAMTVATACHKEDELTPEEDFTISHFLPQAGDTSEEAQIRRQFYQTENSFLLFNDTIRHDLLGTGPDGKEYFKTETIDIGYSVGDNYEQSGSYSYEYLNTVAEKQAAAKFIQEELIPHLGTKDLRPFSWMAAKKVIYTAFGSDTEKTSVKGERCIAVALGDITSADMNKKELSSQIMQSLLGSLIESKEEELENFYAVNNSIYDTRFTNPDFTEEYAWEEVKSKGFIKLAVNDWTGAILLVWYPTKKQDLNAFVELALGKTEAEVNSMYAGYPVIIQKYQLMKQVIESVGYKF